jgi:hypothetical protein
MSRIGWIRKCGIILLTVSTALGAGCASVPGSAKPAEAKLPSPADGTYVATQYAENDLSSYRLQVSIEKGVITASNFELRYAGSAYGPDFTGFAQYMLANFPEELKEMNRKTGALLNKANLAKQYSKELIGGKSPEKIKREMGDEVVYNALLKDWEDICKNPLKLSIHENEQVGDNLGLMHTWYEYIPQSVSENPDKKVPLVITLHGGSNTIEDAEGLGYPCLGAREGFITVSPEVSDPRPNPTANSWNVGYNPAYMSDEDFILNLITYIEKEYPIDTTRVYLAGFSNGGSMANSLMLTHPELFAAAAPVSGVFNEGHFNKFYPLTDSMSGNTIEINPNKIESRIDKYLDDEKEIDLPICFGVGGSDLFYQKGEDGSDPIFDLPDTMSFWLRLNNISETGRNSGSFFGRKLNNVQTIYKQGYTFEIGDYPGDSRHYLKLFTVDKMFHGEVSEESEIAWKFMSRFSRNPDGSITEQ